MNNVWYQINIETKEHALLEPSAMRMLEKGFTFALHGHRIVKADADGWIEWLGKDKESPLPSGCVCDIKSGRNIQLLRESNGVRWGITDYYRPILEPQADQSKEWRGPEDGLPPVGVGL